MRVTLLKKQVPPPRGGVSGGGNVGPLLLDPFEKRGKLFKLVPLFIKQFILQDRELCHFL